MIPKQRNFKIKQNKNPRRQQSVSSMDQSPELRKLHAQFEKEKNNYLQSSEAQDFFNDLFADDDTPIEETLQVLPKPFTMPTLHQDKLPMKPAMESIDYASVFINPLSTVIECQRAYLRFYTESQLYLDPESQSTEQIRALVSDQYYPPVRRYNEIISILKHLPDEEKQMDLDLPPAQYFFERPQVELFDMISFLNSCVNRFLQQVKQQVLTPPLQMNNQQLQQQHENVAIHYFEDAFGAVFTPQFEKTHQKLFQRCGVVGNLKVNVFRQLLKQTDEYKQAFTFQSLKTAFMGIEQLRARELFKVGRNFPLQIKENEALTITSGYELVLQYLQEGVVIYNCQIDDQMSPFVKNSKFWKLREKYLGVVVAASQCYVVVCFFDQGIGQW
ncbi:Conserved_hypothetical protein [Hexamita inflata]|uniref:Uncharacterized protein n=1 Tax=Hexamita inflata TaxID=28002 RepID=A0AA86R6R4_9EUKA|nr:Conserved hypothetical protein [Hexamita inflata]